MAYSLKWVRENLGITSDMIKYYERKELLNKKAYQNPHNKYREYDDKDIGTLWVIKMLIGIGYSVEEIKQITNDTNFNFYESISEKTATLEKQYKEKKAYYEFVKSIKLSGRIPTVKEFGSITFDDFFEYAKENWNFYTEPEMAKFFSLVETLADKPQEDIKLDDLISMEEILANAEQVKVGCTLQAYLNLLCELREYKPSSEVVQKVVRLMYEFTLKYVDEDIKDKFTPEYYAKTQISQYIDSTFAVVNAKLYGEDGCEFIAKALACFGGYKDIYQI